MAGLDPVTISLLGSVGAEDDPNTQKTDGDLAVRSHGASDGHFTHPPPHLFQRAHRAGGFLGHQCQSHGLQEDPAKHRHGAAPTPLRESQ